MTPFDAGSGLAAVFAVVLVQQIGAPVPAWPVLMLFGPYAASHPLHGAAALALAAAASVAGGLPWFWAGSRYGYRVLRLTCRISLSPESCVHRTEKLFERYGAAALLVARLIPGFAHVAPPIAGAVRFSAARFMLYFGAGGAIGAAIPLALGVALHSEVEALAAWASAFSGQSLAVVLILVSVYAAYRWMVRFHYLRGLRGARISVAELQARISRGEKPIVLDVRSRTHRKLDARVIPGALPANVDDLAPALARIPAGREVVVYCACPNDATAVRVAMLLRRRGVREVRPLAGGFDAWVSAGLVTQRPGDDLI